VTDPVLQGMAPEDVRVRFCPSPTGNPHVGVIRTALFNWAFARHYGGTFVFRIEDTDAARDTEQSYRDMLEALRWLGLDWDEGPEVGGPHEPYRQSQRREVYADVAARLRKAGLAYESFSTAADVEERRRARGEDPKLGYDNADRDLTDEQRDALRAAGKAPVLRLRMPDQDWHWDDLVRGPITVAAAHVPDFVIMRSTGDPLYTLVNPVDDVLMGITHVLRGEDLLSSTPRQLAMYDALRQIGIGGERSAMFGHLPFVMGEGNRKLSKRDPQSSLQLYRERGFVPEGLLNYLALLGWAIADDRDVFSMTEMAEAFDVTRVNPNPARFDLAKCEAINGSWIRLLDAVDFADRLLAFMVANGAVPADEGRVADLVRAASPLVQERVATLEEAATMLTFLVVDDARFSVDPAAASSLNAQAGEVLSASLDALTPLQVWDAASIEAALRARLVDDMGIKPRHAFAPARVGVTGRRISPPLFESMELLGRDRSLARLGALADAVAP
jgi:glutamyl-tRNA synthetase